jgi:hypothetical protein
MSAPPLKGQTLTCHNKKRHADELTARAAAMCRLQQPNCTEPDLYVYRCPRCAGWHLTKAPQPYPGVTATDPVAPTRRRPRRNEERV